jgi:hypothetical protein
MTKLTPDDADRIFSSGTKGSDHLASFVRDMRETYSRAPDAATQTRHLRAMAEEFTARPAAAPVRKRRLPVGRAAAAALVGSLLVAGSALAATGHLPDPAQNAVSDAAKVVGLTIPASHAHGDAGKARAAANKARAKQFTKAKKSWTECVAESAREHTGPGPFDPETACGPKPNSQEFRPAPSGPSGPTDNGNGKDNGNHGQPAVDGHGHDDHSQGSGAAVPTPDDNGGHGGQGPGGHGDQGHAGGE